MFCGLVLDGVLGRLVGLVSDLERVAVLDDNIVHVSGPEVLEVFGEGDEMSSRRRTVVLDQVGASTWLVRLPAQLEKPLFQVGVGPDDLVRGDVDQDSPVLCWVRDQTSHPVLEHPNTRHCIVFWRD